MQDLALNPGATISATLSVRLADQVFDGQDTGSLGITDGVPATPGTETAQIATPGPTPDPTPTATP